MANNPLTAHNPQTGEELIFQNGQWLPKGAKPAAPAKPADATIAHNPQTGQEMQFNKDTGKWEETGFFHPLGKYVEAVKEHPLSAVPGTAEGIITSVLQMLESEFQGITSFGYMARGRSPGQALQEAQQVTAGIHPYLPAETTVGKATEGVLGLIPEVSKRLGNASYGVTLKHFPSLAPIVGTAVQTITNALTFMLLPKARGKGEVAPEAKPIPELVDEAQKAVDAVPDATERAAKQRALDAVTVSQQTLSKLLDPKTYKAVKERAKKEGTVVTPQMLHDMLDPQQVQKRWAREEAVKAETRAAKEKEQQVESMWQEHEAAKEALSNRITEPYHEDPYQPNSAMADALKEAIAKQVEARQMLPTKPRIPKGKQGGYLMLPGSMADVEPIDYKGKTYGIFKDKESGGWFINPPSPNETFYSLPSESPWVNQYLGHDKVSAIKELEDQIDSQKSTTRAFAEESRKAFLRALRKKQGGWVSMFGEEKPEPPKEMKTELLASVRDKNRRLEPKTTVEAPGGIEDVKRSIQAKGIYSPATLTVSLPDRAAYLTDGNTRVSAALELGLPNVPVRIETTEVPFTDSQLTKARSIKDLGLTEDMLPRKKLTKHQQADREEVRKLLGDTHQLNSFVGPLDPRILKKAYEFLKSTPGYKAFENGVVTDVQQIIRTVSPETLGPKAKAAGAIIGEGIARKSRLDAIAKNNSKTSWNYWNSRSLRERTSFVDALERGKKLADPMQESLRRGYEARNNRVFEYDQNMGLTYEPVDNYLYHLWKNPKEAETFFTMRYGAKWNNPKFIKERGWNLYKEGIEVGRLEPLYTNPEDIMLAREYASNLMGMRINILRDLERYGIAARKMKGDRQPVGTTAWRAPNGEWYYVNDDASQILHNAFDTRSLWSQPGIPGQLFRGWMFLKNHTTPIILSFSAFHPLHIALGMDFGADMVRNTKEVIAGVRTPVSFVQNLLKEPAGLVQRSRSGSHLVKAWRGDIPEDQLTEHDKAALEAMAEGGFTPLNTLEWNTRARDNFIGAVKRHSVAAAWHLPWAALETLSMPIFEKWIPNLKAANYLEDVTTALRTNPHLMDDPIARRVEFRKLMKSVDNRFGEMNYNQLFWNRMVRDIGQASALSMGWTLGFLREYGGAVREAPEALRPGRAILKGQLDKAMFVGYYTMAAMMAGGLMTYAMTGNLPQDLKDYVYPRIGTNPDGSPKRVNTMFYTREFGSIYNHIQKEGVVSGLTGAVVNKAAPVFPLVTQWMTNLDYRNHEISDPNAPELTRLYQKLSYTMGDLDPISFESIKRTGSTKERVLSVLGFTPAPKYVMETSLEGKIKKLAGYYNKHITPYEKAQYSDDVNQLHHAFRQGDYARYGKLLSDIQAKYGLSGQDMAKIQKGARSDPMMRMFKSLSTGQQVRLLKGMTERELQKYLRAAHRDARERYYRETYGGGS